jgi:hypothetical protein
MLKTVSTQLALASDTLSEILAKGNTSGANDIIMDNGSDIALGSSSQVTVGAGVITTRAGYIKIGTGAANLLFNSAASAVTPELAAENSDGTIDLGRSTSRFKALYLGEGVYLGGTAAANLLDDYEEGTFTAVLGGSGGTSGQTYNFRSAKYTKVGNLVTCVVLVQVAAKGTITGNLQIQGLPFASASYATISAPYLNGWTGVTGAFITATLNSGETVFTFYSVPVDGSSPTILTTTALSAAPQLSFTISYIV